MHSSITLNRIYRFADVFFLLEISRFCWGLLKNMYELIEDLALLKIQKRLWKENRFQSIFILYFCLENISQLLFSEKRMCTPQTRYPNRNYHFIIYICRHQLFFFLIFVFKTFNFSSINCQQVYSIIIDANIEKKNCIYE